MRDNDDLARILIEGIRDGIHEELVNAGVDVSVEDVHVTGVLPTDPENPDVVVVTYTYLGVSGEAQLVL